MTALPPDLIDEARRCDKCSFWCKNDPEGAEGECRRYAMTGMIVLKPDGMQKLTAEQTFWPATYPNDWCGEFQWK